MDITYQFMKADRVVYFTMTDKKHSDASSLRLQLLELCICAIVFQPLRTKDQG